MFTTTFPYFMSSAKWQRNAVMAIIQLHSVHKFCTCCATYIKCL